MKGLVVVADNPLIVAAIRSGVKDNSALKLIGYVDPREATAARIAAAAAHIVLIDEADGSDVTIDLIRSIKELDNDLHVIALTMAVSGSWLEEAFEAGADAAISKAVHPVALATLIRESVTGHVVHAPIQLTVKVAPVETSRNQCELTERELEILSLVSSGATNSMIARQLWITQQTVKFHVSNIYRKLGVANRTEACHYAHVNGIAAAHEVIAEQPRALALAS